MVDTIDTIEITLRTTGFLYFKQRVNLTDKENPCCPNGDYFNFHSVAQVGVSMVIARVKTEIQLLRGGTILAHRIANGEPGEFYLCAEI